MTVTVVITRDRTDRDPNKAAYKCSLWDKQGDEYARGRVNRTASAAKRDAERLFGPLQWTTDVRSLGIEVEWVLQAALVECRQIAPVWPH